MEPMGRESFGTGRAPLTVALVGLFRGSVGRW